MTPTGSDKTEADTAKDLILWCRSQNIHLRTVEVGDISLDFYDASFLQADKRSVGRLRGEDESDEPRGENEKADTGSVDGLFAEALGLNLDAGVPEEQP